MYGPVFVVDACVHSGHKSQFDFCVIKGTCTRYHLGTTRDRAAYPVAWHAVMRGGISRRSAFLENKIPRHSRKCKQPAFSGSGVRGYRGDYVRRPKLRSRRVSEGGLVEVVRAVAMALGGGPRGAVKLA